MWFWNSLVCKLNLHFVSFNHNKTISLSVPLDSLHLYTETHPFFSIFFYNRTFSLYIINPHLCCMCSNGVCCVACEVMACVVLHV